MCTYNYKTTISYLQEKFTTHLQIPLMARGPVDQRAHFELLEPDPQDPVLGRASEGPESIRAGQRPSKVV